MDYFPVIITTRYYSVYAFSSLGLRQSLRSKGARSFIGSNHLHHFLDVQHEKRSFKCWLMGTEDMAVSWTHGGHFMESQG